MTTSSQLADRWWFQALVQSGVSALIAFGLATLAVRLGYTREVTLLGVVLLVSCAAGLSVARSGFDAIHSLATFLDAAGARRRDRWRHYLVDRYRELEMSIVLYAAALFFGLAASSTTLPQLEIPDALRVVSDQAPQIVLGAIGLALPSALRVLMAPRKLLELRFKLVDEIEAERVQAVATGDLRRLAASPV